MAKKIDIKKEKPQKEKKKPIYETSGFSITIPKDNWMVYFGMQAKLSLKK